MATHTQQDPKETSLTAYAAHNIKMLVGIVVLVASIFVGLAITLYAGYKGVVWLGT